jgi:rhomboid family GlyGly-CTERM serine protease
LNVTADPAGGAGGQRAALLQPFVAPAAIAGLAALAELGGEPLRLALRYQRDGLAGGAIWRLATGHLVHLGPSHMLMNVIALGVIAWVFARFLSNIDWWLGGLTAALAIDAGLYLVSTDVAWYVGLSGVLHGVWAMGSVLAWQQNRRESIAFAALIAIKLGYEAWQGPVPLTHAVAAGPVVAVAHAYGAAGGLLYGFTSLAIRSRGRSL